MSSLRKRRSHAPVDRKDRPQEGIGNLLAEGVMKASQQIGKGSEQYAIHVKGQEVPMHEPRLKMALGVGYALSPTGADHCHNMHDTGYVVESEITKPYGVYGALAADDLGPTKYV